MSETLDKNILMCYTALMNAESCTEFRSLLEKYDSCSLPDASSDDGKNIVMLVTGLRLLRHAVKDSDQAREDAFMKHCAMEVRILSREEYDRFLLLCLCIAWQMGRASATKEEGL